MEPLSSGAFCFSPFYKMKFKNFVKILTLAAFRSKRDKEETTSQRIDLVTVFDAILTSRQTREKLQCLYENLMSNNFRKTAVLEKISSVN